MIDRVAYGYVVDFIDFRLINFAVFNGADSFVCVGSFVLIIYLVRELILDAKKPKTAAVGVIKSGDDSGDDGNNGDSSDSNSSSDEK